MQKKQWFPNVQILFSSVLDGLSRTFVFHNVAWFIGPDWRATGYLSTKLGGGGGKMGKTQKLLTVIKCNIPLVDSKAYSSFFFSC